MALKAGTVVDGRYKVERPLGSGGMGSVFVARDTRMERRVALKITAATGAARESVKARFKREALIGDRLGRSFPCFVRASDWGEVDPTNLYLVMDLIENARDLDLAEGALPARLDRLRRAIEVVGKAHAAGVIHRDLKPANFLQAASGDVYLTDFGLAKASGAPEDDSAAEPTGGLTQDGVGMGTPNFMPPEQYSDLKLVDARADVYALGVMLYLALSGRLPYPGNYPEIISKHVRIQSGQTKAPRPRDVNPAVPTALDELCARATALGADKRPKDARELLALLDAAIATANLSSSGAVTRTEIPPTRMTSEGPTMKPEIPPTRVSIPPTRASVAAPAPQAKGLGYWGPKLALLAAEVALDAVPGAGPIIGFFKELRADQKNQEELEEAVAREVAKVAPPAPQSDEDTPTAAPELVPQDEGAAIDEARAAVGDLDTEERERLKNAVAEFAKEKDPARKRARAIEVASALAGSVMRRRAKHTEESFFEALTSSSGDQLSKFVRGLVVDLTKLGLQANWNSTTVTVRMYTGGQSFTPLVLSEDGHFNVNLGRLAEKGYGDVTYVEDLARLAGAEVTASGGSFRVPRPSISTLVERRESFLALVESFVRRIGKGPSATATAPARSSSGRIGSAKGGAAIDAVVEQASPEWQPVLVHLAGLLDESLGTLLELDVSKIWVNYKVASPLSGKTLRLLGLGVDKVVVTPGYLSTEGENTGHGGIQKAAITYREALSRLLGVDMSTIAHKEIKAVDPLKTPEARKNLARAALEAARAVKAPG